MNKRMLIGLLVFFVAILSLGSLLVGKIFLRPDNSAMLKSAATTKLMSLPVRFEANEGQSDKEVKFIVQGLNEKVFLASSKMIFTPLNKDGKQDIVRLDFTGANENSQITGIEKLATISNYFVGNNKNNWHTKVTNYSKAYQKDLYAGIDVKYYDNKGVLEYDFIVAPKADPNQIKFKIAGANKILVNEKGELVVRTSSGEIKHHKPIIYQEMGNGKKQEIEGCYAMVGSEIGFKVGEYDSNRSLVIDPVVNFWGYTGILTNYSTNNVTGCRPKDIEVDNNGYIYLSGETPPTSLNFTSNFYPPASTYRGFYVIKIDPSGQHIIYSCFLGGAYPAWHEGGKIALDPSSNIYITGLTEAVDFPVVNPIQNATTMKLNTYHAFVSVIRADGAELLFSSVLGGNQCENGNDIIYKNNKIYICGATFSTDFPVTPDALQPTFAMTGSSNAFLTILEQQPQISSLMPSSSSSHFYKISYSTYFSAWAANSMAIDNNNLIYLTGDVRNNFMKTTSGAIQTQCHGNKDAFVLKLSPDAKNIIYSTYFGGSEDDYGVGIAVTPAFPGVAFVAGNTHSKIKRLSLSSIQPILSGTTGASDGFVIAIGSAGQVLRYGTYLGGSGWDTLWDIDVDNRGNAYIIGTTSSKDLPLIDSLPSTYVGSLLNSFISVIDNKGDKLLFSSYLGSSSVVECTGITLNRQKDFGIIYGCGTGTPSLVNPPTIAGSSVFFMKLTL